MGGQITSLGKEISEKLILFHIGGCYDPDTKEPTSATQVVYHCKQVFGPEIGKEAIMKFHLQAIFGGSHKPTKVKLYEPNISAKLELEVLQKFTAKKCSSAPQLLGVGVIWSTQSATVISEVEGCRYEHQDPRLGNLIYDDEKDKCYMIDWESSFRIINFKTGLPRKDEDYKRYPLRDKSNLENWDLVERRKSS
ncbi:hypothetical protein FQN57_002121 [Myotisia sp. PD_48]|nr:hypothetical protein FQN57_002121 [Myotisia sp. PD_48]